MARSAPSPGKLMTVKEVAELSGLSEKTIRRAIEDRAVAVTRIGGVRISEAAYADWVRRKTGDTVL